MFFLIIIRVFSLSFHCAASAVLTRTFSKVLSFGDNAITCKYNHVVSD